MHRVFVFIVLLIGNSALSQPLPLLSIPLQERTFKTVISNDGTMFVTMREKAVLYSTGTGVVLHFLETNQY